MQAFEYANPTTVADAVKALALKEVPRPRWPAGPICSAL